MLDEDSLFDDLTPICKGMGLTLVDCRLQQSKSGSACQVIIFKKEGVSTADCALCYRTLMPRLEIVLNTQDVSLEVSSPGTDRKIRLPREYTLFIGRGMTVLRRDASDESGILVEADEESISLSTKKGTVRILLSDITKAKLDYTQEVR